MTVEFHTLLAIVAMGLATFATRLAGYWLLQGRSVTGRLKVAMDAVPAAILVSVIAPNVFLGGDANMMGGAAALLSALLRQPLLMTIFIGCSSVACLRAMGF
jgi:uncharacterized membrane protein